MPLPHSVVANFRHLVYAYALRLVGDEEDAGDIAQEVLIRVWQKGAAVEAERLRAWILRVTRNACLDHLRSRHRRGTALSPDNGLIQQVCDANPLPDGLCEAVDARQWIERALQLLDEPYRSAVILREIHGLPYSDIAEVLDLPLSTMKVYLHRGRKRLREHLLSLVPQDELLP